MTQRKWTTILVAAAVMFLLLLIWLTILSLANR